MSAATGHAGVKTCPYLKMRDAEPQNIQDKLSQSMQQLSYTAASVRSILINHQAQQHTSTIELTMFVQLLSLPEGGDKNSALQV